MERREEIDDRQQRGRQSPEEQGQQKQDANEQRNEDVLRNLEGKAGHDGLQEFKGGKAGGMMGNGSQGPMSSPLSPLSLIHI